MGRRAPSRPCPFPGLPVATHSEGTLRPKPVAGPVSTLREDPRHAQLRPQSPQARPLRTTRDAPRSPNRTPPGARSGHGPRGPAPDPGRASLEASRKPALRQRPGQLPASLCAEPGAEGRGRGAGRRRAGGAQRAVPGVTWFAPHPRRLTLAESVRGCLAGSLAGPTSTRGP